MDETISEISARVARGEYHLLLGAGASASSKNAKGDLLPTGPGLKQWMLDDFAVPAGGDSASLPELYGYMKGKSLESLDGQSLNAYLKSKLTGCSPASWYSDLTSMRWETVWTLNIDDVAEAAWRGTSTAGSQSARPYSWSDTYQVPDLSEDEMQIVHLHGMASRLDDGESEEHPLVFSIVEYLRAYDRGASWHRVFGDWFREKPFVILGASLRDELDLQEILETKNQSMQISSRPSVIVLRSITEFDRSRLESYGLRVITGDIGEFVGRLHSAVTKEHVSIPGASGLVKLDFDSESIRFLSQFIPLDLHDPVLVPKSLDFYEGREPDWNDILLEKDVVLRTAENVIEKILIENDKSKLHLITGEKWTGKSATVLRISRNLITHGYTPFLFRGNGALDVNAALFMLKRWRTPAVLVFDGLADNATKVSRLLDQLNEDGQCRQIVACERSRRDLKPIYASFHSSAFEGGRPHVLNALSNQEIDRLIGRLDAHNRLGRLTTMSPEQRRSYCLNEGNRRLFEILSRISGESGFRRKVRDLLDDITPGSLREAVFVVAIASELGHPVPVNIAADVASIESSRIVKLLRSGNPISEIMDMDSRGNVRFWNRYAASLVKSTGFLSNEGQYKVTLRLAKILSAYINKSTIKSKSIHHLIASSVMGREMVVSVVGRHKALEWYAELEDLYQWHARYWDQRALCALKASEYTDAEHFAYNAVGAQPDSSHSLGVLGNVLLTRSIGDTDDYSAALEYYRRGVDELKRSVRLERFGAGDSFFTFFNRGLEFARTWHLDSSDGLQRLRSDWNQWMVDAEAYPFFSHEENWQKIQDLKQRFALVVLGEGY